MEGFSKTHLELDDVISVEGEKQGANIRICENCERHLCEGVRGVQQFV